MANNSTTTLVEVYTAHAKLVEACDDPHRIIDAIRSMSHGNLFDDAQNADQLEGMRRTLAWLEALASSRQKSV